MSPHALCESDDVGGRLLGRGVHVDVDRVVVGVAGQRLGKGPGERDTQVAGLNNG